MERIICLVIGYIFGLFQTGYIVGKLHHIDIRQQGSGNAGSTNAVRVMGWKAGLCTFAGDVLKCVLAICLTRYIYRDTAYAPMLAMYAGVGATLGHNFPFYLKFKGGKGIAVLAGLVVATHPVLVPIPLACFLIASILTRYVSLGSLLAATTFFMEIILYGEMGGLGMSLNYRIETYVLACVIMVLAWFRHKENIKRLIAGTENRFGSKKQEKGVFDVANVGVIGAGSWGTALSVLLDDNGHQVTIWSIDPEEVKMLNEQREHAKKLPGVKLSDKMVITGNLQEAIEGKDFLVLAVPSPFTRATAKKMCPYVAEGQKIVDVAKGIEESTLKTLSQQIEEEIPQADVAVLSGPSHAEEVGRKLPTTCVIGAKTKKTAEYLQKAFISPVFRVYISPDILGIELGGSLKNVIALAAGMADGLGYGDNTKAALITRGIAEIARLGMKMGGKLETFTGLTGIGDLIVTCASVHSRNRKAGYLMGQGKSMQEAMDEVQMVVEGVYSAKAAARLAEKYDVSMPIVTAVNQILFEGKKARDAVNELMLRESKNEHASLPWPDEV